MIKKLAKIKSFFLVIKLGLMDLGSTVDRIAEPRKFKRRKMEKDAVFNGLVKMQSKLLASIKKQRVNESEQE